MGDKRRSRASSAQNAASSAHRRQLEEMFSPGGKGLPEHLKAQLGPPSEERLARQEALNCWRDEPNDHHLKQLLEAGIELPADARQLMSSLDSLESEDSVRSVLSRLLEIVEGGKKPNRMLLLQRLTALELRIEEDSTQSLIRDLRGALE